MNISSQLASYRDKGFTDEQAEVITLMHLAAGVLFRDFPDSFLLIGGAALLLFHQSVRHSGDLDLLIRADDPSCRKPYLRLLRETDSSLFEM
jgi:hypothetical protein